MEDVYRRAIEEKTSENDRLKQQVAELQEKLERMNANCGCSSSVKATSTESLCSNDDDTSSVDSGITSTMATEKTHRLRNEPITQNVKVECIDLTTESAEDRNVGCVAVPNARFKCRKCDRQFNSLHDLEKHEWVHNSGRPFDFKPNQHKKFEPTPSRRGLYSYYKYEWSVGFLYKLYACLRFHSIFFFVFKIVIYTQTYMSIYICWCVCVFFIWISNKNYSSYNFGARE